MIHRLRDLDAREASAALEKHDIEAIEILPPRGRANAYQELALRAIELPRFMLDLGGTWTDIGATLNDKLSCVCRDHVSEAVLAQLLDDVQRLLAWGASLAGARRTLLSLRNWFAPGDLVWHVDRSRRSRALRILWPLARSGGIYIARRDSIDPVLYRAWMAREHPLLCRLDRLVFESGEPLERVWAHRPRQIHAMRTGEYPFLRDREGEHELDPRAISVHRLETPNDHGTWHRSSYANSQTPGLQFIMTVTT
jgi:hypothetical protein